jgi:glutamine amidotransferase PdxT
MSTLAIDTRKLLEALKGTGKSANFTAEEIADAVDVAQEDSELLTRSEFRVRMDAFKVQMDAFGARIDAMKARIDAIEARFDARLEALRADIKAEIKAGQVQNLMWLSGIVLASNGIIMALLARLAHVV